jgi:uncharacterized membrane protein
MNDASISAEPLAPVPAGAGGVAAPAREREIAIDWVRGLVMVLMALDHTRDFYHGMRGDPTDLATTTPLLFATRIVTHVCAPVFIFLAGTAAYLYGRSRTPAARSRFLFTRGLWLVVLELTVVRFGWIPDPGFHFTTLQVIWAIGCSMIALSAISRLPLPVVIGLSAIAVAGHDLLDGVHAARFGELAWLWNVLHEPTRLTPAPGHMVFVAYPLVPWMFVMALGYAFGTTVELPRGRRRTLWLRTGCALLLAFVIVRAIDRYGDPTPWQAQRSWLWTAMAFVNVEKYPPSLDYLLMTLGPALIALALAPERRTAFGARPLLVFGRVPLFFYVAHLYVLRYPSIVLGYLRFGTRALAPPPHGTGGSPEWPLGYVYLAWLAALIALYPMCRWFARIKAERRHPLLSYL